MIIKAKEIAKEYIKHYNIIKDEFEVVDIYSEDEEYFNSPPHLNKYNVIVCRISRNPYVQYIRVNESRFKEWVRDKKIKELLN